MNDYIEITKKKPAILIKIVGKDGYKIFRFDINKETYYMQYTGFKFAVQQELADNINQFIEWKITNEEGTPIRASEGTLTVNEAHEIMERLTDLMLYAKVLYID